VYTSLVQRSEEKASEPRGDVGRVTTYSPWTALYRNANPGRFWKFDRRWPFDWHPSWTCTYFFHGCQPVSANGRTLLPNWELTRMSDRAKRHASWPQPISSPMSGEGRDSKPNFHTIRVHIPSTPRTHHRGCFIISDEDLSVFMNAGIPTGLHCVSGCCVVRLIVRHVKDLRTISECWAGVDRGVL